MNDPDAHELAPHLLALQRVLFDYPLASQAAFAALVAEGKRFAATEEGARLEERLRDSELVSRGRVVWEVLTQSAFTADASSRLPSVILDSFARATAIDWLEPFLSLCFEESVE